MTTDKTTIGAVSRDELMRDLIANGLSEAEANIAMDAYDAGDVEDFTLTPDFAALEACLAIHHSSQED